MLTLEQGIDPSFDVHPLARLPTHPAALSDADGTSRPRTSIDRRSSGRSRRWRSILCR